MTPKKHLEVRSEIEHFGDLAILSAVTACGENVDYAEATKNPEAVTCRACRSARR